MTRLAHRLLSPIAVALLVSLAGLASLAASDLDLTAEGSIEAESQLVSSVGGGTFDLGAFSGAGRYYSNGITGQNTKTANVESGHIWNGHEALAHVTNYFQSANTWSNGNVAALYDRHATWVGLVIGGRQTGTNANIKQQGIAYGTDLISGAIATSWIGSAYAASFNISDTTYRVAFTNAFAQADVINSSYAYVDQSGSDNLTEFTDALLRSNPTTSYVVSAGNSGSGANTVGAPGSGYNTITVGALGNANTYNTVASFSSRGPQDFLNYSNGNPVIVAGVRAAVDISAPGESVTSAYFGGQSGGNNPALSGSAAWATNANSYTTVDGTSFSAPLVAGGVSLMASAAKTLVTLSNNNEARQNVVLKAILLTGADKTAGWSNGQAMTNGVITTTQSLDWAVGAGRMNLNNNWDIQVSGQTGVAGTNTGYQGKVAATGWDFGAAQIGLTNDYALSGRLLGGSTFTTTLSWLRERGYTGMINAVDRAQADLNLSLWQLGVNNVFDSVVAQSVSLYNNEEHLSFSLPSTGYYGLRVSYASNTFDLTGTWGTAGNRQTYGLAWAGTALGGDQVVYQMQTGRFNALLTEKNLSPPYAGIFNNGTNEVGLYANQGSFGNTPGAAAFQTFTTTGNGNTGAVRPMQAGDTFTIVSSTSANPSAGGRVGISFRDSTNYTDFFSATDGDTEARWQLDSSGNWKIYEGNTAQMTSGSGSGTNRTLVLKITSSTTFDAQIGGTWYYNFTMGAGGGLIDSLALYSYGDSNADSLWKNGLLEDTGTVELGYALGSATSRTYGGNVFTPGVITDGLVATNASAVRTNAVFIGGDAGSQVNLVNSNTYSGLTTVNANATAELQHAFALGSTSAGTTVSSGGAVKLYSATGISCAAESITLNGTGVGGANGALRNVGGTNTWNGSITLGSDARINADTTGGAGLLTIAGAVAGGANVLFVGTTGSAITISGAISGAGNTNAGTVTSLFKDGAGTLTLTGSNSFTGATRVAAGTLTAAGTGGNQALGATARVTVDAGAKLLLGTSNQVSDSAAITLSGGTITRATGVSEVFGNLNLTQASFLDFGTGLSGTFQFGAYAPSFLLSVANFLPGNTLIFASNLTGTINNGSLFSFSQAFNSSWSGSQFTITAIPESATVVAAFALLGLFATSYLRESGVSRRRSRR
ncbi:MAG: autotransporter-associated beta strand repeat-containing protein [Chthoniobacterales bacterium]